MRFVSVAAIPLLAVGVPLAAAVSASAHRHAAPIAVTVYKNAQCGCCTSWVDHLRKEGFEVTAKDVEDLAAIKSKLGVPASLGSCHTAVVRSYVVEGHVPAADIQKLLAQKPKVAGIGVAGMPIGSPGMEVPGRPAEKYQVMAFTKDGQQKVFASH